MPVSANGQGISEVLKSLVWIPFTDIAPAVYVPSHSDNGAAGLNAHREDVTCGDLANVPPAADITLPPIVGSHYCSAASPRNIVSPAR